MADENRVAETTASSGTPNPVEPGSIPGRPAKWPRRLGWTKLQERRAKCRHRWDLDVIVLRFTDRENCPTCLADELQYWKARARSAEGSAASEKARTDKAEAELARHETCVADNGKAFDKSLGECLGRAEKAEAALTSANAEIERAWRSNNANVEAVFAARREVADLQDHLRACVGVVDAAGLLNLSGGVQLGATSWYVKASDAFDAARLAVKPDPAAGLVVCEHCPDHPHPLNDDGTKCKFPKPAPAAEPERFFPGASELMGEPPQAPCDGRVGSSEPVAPAPSEFLTNGQRAQVSLAEHRLRLKVLFNENEQRPLPDTALRGALLDADRFADELCEVATAPIATPAPAQDAKARPFDKRGADRLADEVAVLVLRKVIDSRSPAADALLDYRNPPRTPRADRLAELEAKYASAEAQISELLAMVEHPRIRPIVNEIAATPAPPPGADLERKAQAWAAAIEYCEEMFSPKWLADQRNRGIFAAHIYRLLTAARAQTGGPTT